MNERGVEGAPRPTKPAKKWLWVIAGVVLAFLAGYIWQNLEAREAQEALEEAEGELVFQRLGNILGAAAVQASYGNYEPARQLASRFYSSLDQHLAEAPGAEDRQRTLRALLENRDAMITALSRGNPDSGDLLAQAFVRFHHAVGGIDPGPDVPATAGSGPGTTGAPAPEGDTAAGGDSGP